ncbi:MAG: hypothetical protein LRY57_01035 [Alphaproteobacteria bacterium]|nr:hypothetical protein [Alphaproteobacteria bacterium]
MTILHSARKVCMLCSALGMLGGFAPAVAQEKPDSAAVSAPVYFHPAAVWEVKSLQDPQSGAKICTIAAPFNNGFFIQMTAAQEGINSISINFRQDVFAAGTTANVGISAPGVLKSVLPAVAFKPELLAINFQGQGALFDAIKTAGVMEFSMGADNQFRFISMVSRWLCQRWRSVCKAMPARGLLLIFPYRYWIYRSCRCSRLRQLTCRPSLFGLLCRKLLYLLHYQRLPRL